MSLLTSSSSQPRPVLPKTGKKQPLSATNAPPLYFGSAASTAQTATKLTFWQTLNAIRKQWALGDKETQEIFKGLALKHGPDLALPAFFAIPVVGWAAGIIALPFMGWMEKRGTKIIDNKRAYLADNTHHPLYHYVKLQDLWDGVPRPPKKADPKNPATNRETAYRMARTWNRFIDKLFSHKDGESASSILALKQKLSISLEEGTKNPTNKHIFSMFERFINAREGLQKLSNKWYYKYSLKPLDTFYKKFPLPKILKMVVLLPKLSILAIFYLLKIKPSI